MEREQIIKALECHADGCKCSQCPMPKRTKEQYLCWTELSKATLSLIKELTEEKDTWEAIAKSYQKQFEDCADDRAKLTEENERLKCEISDLKDELKCEKETNAHLCSQYMSENHLRAQAEEMLANGMSVVNADTLQKAQKKLLKDAFCSACGIDYSHHIIQTIKEMLEGE